MTLHRLIDAMSRPDFYPHAPASVELIQTHASWVFIAGNEVYKVKKPVRFDFLDFTTLEKRKFYCEEELRLNRRLAQDVYLDVTPLSQDRQGRFHPGDAGTVIEYAVRMKKLPADRMLKALLHGNQADEQILNRVALRIAAFHASARTGPHIDEVGSMATLRQNHEENFEETKMMIGVTLPRHQYHLVSDFARVFMSQNETLFAKRVTDHRIRDCHGDLHLDHICVTNEIFIFDCIEFNERFRFVDTAAEISFLMMDLDYNGFTADADMFLKHYIHYSMDSELLRLLNFYRCYYAFVRGKVTGFRLRQSGIAESERTDILQSATQYFDLAYGYAARLEKPVLIVTAGLIGSGKSYQAGEIAPRLGAKIIRSDVLRKQLLGIAPSEKHHDAFGGGIYSADITSRTYAKALELAEAEMKAGYPVILDASFSLREQREEAVKLSQKINVPFYLLECVCPEEVVKKRLEKRAQNPDNPSDGRREILREQKKHYQEIRDVPAGHYWQIDTSDRPERARQHILHSLKIQEMKRD
jgi:aminoglycoside phosphotransferase family enzyme/predicted kinase